MKPEVKPLGSFSFTYTVYIYTYQFKAEKKSSLHSEPND